MDALDKIIAGVQARRATAEKEARQREFRNFHKPLEDVAIVAAAPEPSGYRNVKFDHTYRFVGAQ